MIVVPARLCQRRWRVAGAGSGAGSGAGACAGAGARVHAGARADAGAHLVKTLAVVAPARLRRHVVVPATSPILRTISILRHTYLGVLIPSR